MCRVASPQANRHEVRGQYRDTAMPLGFPAEQRLHGRPPTHSEGNQMELVHLNQKQLATRWGVSEASLERWRSVGIGPVFLKLQGQVRYRAADIEAYEAACLSRSTCCRGEGLTVA